MVSKADRASGVVRWASLMVHSQLADFVCMCMRCAVVLPVGVLYCLRVQCAVVQSLCLMGRVVPLGEDSLTISTAMEYSLIHTYH